MKYILSYITLFLLGVSTINSQDSLYVRTYGTTEDEVFKDIDTLQGDFYITGQNTTCGSSNLSIVVLDSNFDMVSQVSYGDENAIESGEAIEVINNRVYIGGVTDKTANSEYNPLLVEVNRNAEVINHTYIQKNAWTTCEDIVGITSGSIIGVGKTLSATNQWDAYMFCVDENLTLLWEKSLGGSSDDELSGICRYNANTLVACGFTESQGAGMKDFYLLAFDTLGTILWEKTIGDIKDEFASNLIRTLDGGLAICGTTASYPSNSEDPFLVKTDSLGNFIWEANLLQRYPDSTNTFSDQGVDLFQQDNGRFFVYFYNRSFWETGIKDIDAIDVTPNGTVGYGYEYYGDHNDEPLAAIYLGGRTRIYVGSTSSNGQGGKDGILAITETISPSTIQRSTTIIDENILTENCVVNIPELSATEQVSVYPNPFQDHITITSKGNRAYRISLFGISGKLIWEVNHFSNSSIRLPSEIEDGVYVLRLNDGENTIHQRIVRAR